MKIIKSAWLEMIFALFILAAAIIGYKNLWANVDFFSFTNPKTIEKSDIEVKAKPLEDYIREISSMKNCTAIFTVKDIQGTYLTQEMADELKRLGFNKADTLLENEYHAFIGIYCNGEVLYQYVGGDELATYNGYVNDHYVVVKSGTWANRNTGLIYVDDVSYSVNTRGINIVLINNSDNTLIDSIAFDTYDENIPVYRNIDGKATVVLERTVQNAE